MRQVGEWSWREGGGGLAPNLRAKRDSERGGSRAPGPWTGGSFTASVTWGPQSGRELAFISWAQGSLVGLVRWAEV